jgi:hypothetical protein
MTGDLASVEVKLERARRHLAELEARTKAIVAACRKAIVHERDERTAEHVFRFDQVPVVENDVGAIAGDVIHNLRAALDYLAWQLVLVSGNLPTRRTGFPIEEVQGSELPQIAPGVSHEMRACLDAVQPYKRTPRGKPANHPLAALHDLDIADKHHELIVVVLFTRDAGWWGGDVDVKVTGFNAGPYRDGDEVARFAVADGRDDFDSSFGFSVCLNEPAAGAVGRHLGVAQFLEREPMRYIENEVLARFRQFF